MTDEATIRVDSPGSRTPTAHRWFARRTDLAAATVVLLANDPALALEPTRLLQLASATGPSPAPLEGHRVLDLCSGAGTVGLAAARLGGQVTALDNHPIAVLVGRCLLQYAPWFGGVHHEHRGIGDGNSWAGLEPELRHWSQVLVDHIQRAAGEAWLGVTDAVVCRPVTICQNCGKATDFMGEGAARGTAKCVHCQNDFVRRDAAVVGFEPVREIRGRSERDLSQEVRSVLAASDHQNPWLEDEPFVSTRQGTVPVSRTITPRQASVLAASQRALRSTRDDLAERGYEPNHVAALVTTLGLALSSSLVEMLTTTARWDKRTHRLRALDVHDWRFPWEFAEAGGAELRRRFERQIDDTCAALTSVAGTGVAISGDMTRIDLPDGSFDVVVWDPPFYDNIDYQALAAPWVRYLRATIGELHPDLDWTASSSPSPIEPFDAVLYEQSLAEASSEVARVLDTDGSLGVFWIRRRGQEEDDLTGLLHGLESSGLELIQSVRLDKTITTFDSPVEPVFLVFRKTVIVQPSNAGQIVAGLDEHRPMMAAGLADLLERYLDDDDLNELIPSDFRGNRRQRLQEAVMADRDPLRVMARLRRRELAEFVEERSPGTADGLTGDELAQVVLELLGWRVPRPVGFSIGEALDECDRQASVLSFTSSEAEARGAAKAALAGVEGVLRFSVVAWAHLIAGDDWQQPIADVAGKSSHLSFGDWRRAFTELPARHAANHEALGRASGRLRQSRVGPPLDRVVGLRNDIDHPDRAPWGRVRLEAPEVLGNIIRSLRAANDKGALPRVLQPSTETRDPYGRITLRLVGYGGRSTEFLMTRPSDLTIPIVYFPGESNPREVHPASLPAPDVQERAGLY